MVAFNLGSCDGKLMYQAVELGNSPSTARRSTRSSTRTSAPAPTCRARSRHVGDDGGGARSRIDHADPRHGGMHRRVPTKRGSSSTPPPGTRAASRPLVGRRCRGEPIAWITGSVVFCDVRGGRGPGRLRPAVWHTEELARRVAELLPPGGVAVDLCTGSGAIRAGARRVGADGAGLATELDPTVLRLRRGNGVEVFGASSTTGSAPGSSTVST